MSFDEPNMPDHIKESADAILTKELLQRKSYIYQAKI